MNLHKRDDELKVMIGYSTEKPAHSGYVVNYERRWKGLGDPQEHAVAGFKEWLRAPRGAYKGEERRKDFEKRKRVEKMTIEEMRKELLTDPLTNLGNRRAYEEDPRLPVQVFVDVDSLKWINDNISHEAGDELLKTVGWALDSLDDSGYRSYHIFGDEFIIQAKSVGTAKAAIRHALAYLDEVIFAYTLSDGTTITKKGAGISYGIATTVELAEEELRKHKAERQAKGFRAARGETPPGVARGEFLAAHSGHECRASAFAHFLKMYSKSNNIARAHGGREQ